MGQIGGRLFSRRRPVVTHGVAPCRRYDADAHTAGAASLTVACGARQLERPADLRRGAREAATGTTATGAGSEAGAGTGGCQARVSGSSRTDAPGSWASS